MLRLKQPETRSTGNEPDEGRRQTMTLATIIREYFHRRSLEYGHWYGKRE
jgi:hypothetical protein